MLYCEAVVACQSTKTGLQGMCNCRNCHRVILCLHKVSNIHHLQGLRSYRGTAGCSFKGAGTGKPHRSHRKVFKLFQTAIPECREEFLALRETLM